MRARIRDERRQARAEWRRAWRSVPPAEQKRIRDALRRGTEVDDPALAAVAAEAAEHRSRCSASSAVASSAAAANRALAGEPRYPPDTT